MDIVTIFKHSRHEDFELRHSLRSIERHAPYIRKVWIFGDRPSFIADDTSLIEHVPEEYTALLLGLRPPVRNMFLLLVLSSLIPDLAFEYLFFCDDFYLLKDYPIEEARTDRYLEDLTPESPKPRGRGLWKDNLWRTRDLLIRLGYPAFNFEAHVPMYLTRKRVLEAYREFRNFITEDRFFGIMGVSAILNYALKHEKGASRPPIVCVKSEASRGGFWGRPPLTYEAVLHEAEGKKFFNFDDDAFCPVIARFLQERFPHPSKYEKG